LFLEIKSIGHFLFQKESLCWRFLVESEEIPAD